MKNRMYQLVRKAVMLTLAIAMILPCVISAVFAEGDSIPAGMQAEGSTDVTLYLDYVYRESCSSIGVVYTPEDTDTATNWTVSDPDIIPSQSGNQTDHVTFSSVHADYHAGNTALTAVSAADPELLVQFNVSVVDDDPPTGTFTAECSYYPVIYQGGSYFVDWEHRIGRDICSMELELGKIYYLETEFRSETCAPSSYVIQKEIDNTGLLSSLPVYDYCFDYWSESKGTMYIGTLFTADQTGTGTIHLGNDKEISVTVSGWKYNDYGWWYDSGDDTQPSGTFQEINGQTYYFGADGYMVTGWQYIRNNWYYFASSGTMKTSAWEGDYWLNEDGRMATSAWVDGGKYYVDRYGRWSPAHWEKNSRGWWYNYGDGSYPKNGFETIGSERYYFDKKGYMETGWKYVSTAWYYLGISGAASRGWDKINGVWYFFDEYNRMLTGLQTINGATYYFDDRGRMETGWQYINDAWYLFKYSGARAENEWDDVYYLKDDGKMAQSEWVNDHYFGPDGALVDPYGEPHWAQNRTGWRYDIDGYGHYAANTWKMLNNEWYYFSSGGYIQTGWYYENSKWYYLTDSGAFRNQWLKYRGYWYYFGDNCAMVTGSRTINGKTYNFTRNGIWVDGIIEDYVSEAIRIAYDDSHGYNSIDRWGPDYDCSSFVLTCLMYAGIDIGTAHATTDMVEELTARGWTWHTDLTDVRRGDIILNASISGHAAIALEGYTDAIGGYTTVADAGYGNFIPGDQSDEIDVRRFYFSYSNPRIEGFLRYEGY